MLTEAMFAAWLDRYEAAWEGRDPAAAMALFTLNATYREAPFEAPMAGREAVGEYWGRQVGRQDRVDFTYEVLAVTGDCGLAWWRSRFDWLPTGRRIELDGIFRCRFRIGGADDGLCFVLEEWWHRREVGDAGSLER